MKSQSTIRNLPWVMKVGLASLVDQLGNIPHGFVYGKIFEAAVNHQAEDQAKDAEENAEEQEFVAIDTEELHPAQIGKLQAGLAARFFRGLSEAGRGREQRNDGSGGAEFCKSTSQCPGRSKPGAHQHSSVRTKEISKLTA
jgi:hypothetical protein